METIKRFTPEIQKWTPPFFNLAMFIIAKRVSVKNQEQNGKGLQMRWIIVSHFIWIYTVCKGFCFLYRTVRVTAQRTPSIDLNRSMFLNYTWNKVMVRFDHARQPDATPDIFRNLFWRRIQIVEVCLKRPGMIYRWNSIYQLYQSSFGERERERERERKRERESLHVKKKQKKKKKKDFSSKWVFFS